jgi:hypothetical protein
VSEKKVSEMTFQEFLQKAREVGTDFRAINDIESFILGNMQQEGFAKKQVYSMNMNRLWSLWVAAVSNIFEKDISRISKALEKNPNLANNYEPILRNLNNNLEKLADELEDELNKKEKESKSKGKDKE